MKSIKNHPEIVFVVAAGPHGDEEATDAKDTIPANIEEPNVITVAATDLEDKRASFSNFGNVIDISAPGVNVYTTNLFIDPLNENDYVLFSGTSAAAPMVTGVVALLLAIDPNLTPQEIKNILVETGDPIITDKDKPISGKRLNAFKAVEKLLETLQPPPPTSPPSTPPPSPAPEPSAEICNDGIDNDQDGKLDCLDSECSLNPACNEICNDGIDNNQDGLVDCADRVECGLNPACNEICDDGIDNDFDGRIDCADPSCSLNPAC